MKSNFSDLTYKIVAFQEISEIKTSEIVEWALEMVELGYESDNLFMLASFEKDSNFYEIESYLIKALEELKIDSKNGKDVMNLLSELNREGTTIVMVTHSQHDSTFAHRVINLFDGQIVSEVESKM